jgi:hypothetical protein
MFVTRDGRVSVEVIRLDDREVFKILFDGYAHSGYRQYDRADTNNVVRLDVELQAIGYRFTDLVEADGHVCQDAAYGPCPRPECGQSWK